MAELSLPRPAVLRTAPLLLLLPLLLVALELTPVDAWFSNLFYDATRQIFPLKHDWWFETLFHTGGRWLVVSIGLAAIVASVSTLWIHKELRTTLAFVVLSMVLSTGAVAVLKALSPIHCPYDLVEYGGDYARVALFATAPAQQPPGHCWPAGHASAGFSLWAFYFAVPALAKRRRQWLFWVPLIAGLLYGLVQTARGAHFMSHTLWTGCIVWWCNAVLAKIMLRRQDHASAAG